MNAEQLQNWTKNLRNEMRHAFLDNLGFVTINGYGTDSDAKNERYDNHNQNLFNGVYAFFLYHFNILQRRDVDTLFEANKLVTAKRPGNLALIHRHPVAWGEREKHDVASHDEYYGRVVSLKILDMIGKDWAGSTLAETVAYGARNGWIYDDHAKGTQKGNVRYTRQLHVRAFYKWMAGWEPGILEKLWFFVANIWAAYETMKHSNNKHLAWLRLEAMTVLEDDEPATSRFTRTLFRQIVTNRYAKKHGKFSGYTQAIFNHYYGHAKHMNFPFLGFAKAYDQDIGYHE